jgi:hypothetical protein
VGDGGCGNASFGSPGAAVEDAGEAGEQDVAPVEVGGALVEVGEAEEDRSGEQRRGSAETLFEQILEPAAEEELFGDGDEEEREEEREGRGEKPVPLRVDVEEAQREAEEDGDGGVDCGLAETEFEISATDAEIEADTLELADGEEAVDAGVEQEDLAEDGEVWRPGGLEPAEIDGEADGGEDEEVAPVAVLGWVFLRGTIEEPGDGDGE